MTQRRRAVSLLFVRASFLLVGRRCFAQSKDEQEEERRAEEGNPEHRQDRGRRGGRSAGANDLSLTWVREDVLKAQGNKEYVPFTSRSIRRRSTAARVAFYWRVVAEERGAAGRAPRRREEGRQEEGRQGQEDRTTPTRTSASCRSTAGQTPMRISRSFTVPAGSYDVFSSRRSRRRTKRRRTRRRRRRRCEADRDRARLLERRAGDQLRDHRAADRSAAGAAHAAAAGRPAVRARQMEIVPALETKFTKKSELSTFMLIYNPKVDSANKPDVLRRVQLLPEGRPGSRRSSSTRRTRRT